MKFFSCCLGDRCCPPYPQLGSRQCGVAGEKCHLQAALLHLLHVGQFGPLPVLWAPALLQVGLFLLAAPADPQSQNQGPYRIWQQVKSDTTLPGAGRAQNWRGKLKPVAFFSLMQHLTLFTEDPDGEYTSQEVVWRRFEKAFIAAAGLITHAPVLRDYLYRGLTELQLDNIMYLELRSGLSKVLTPLRSDISALMHWAAGSNPYRLFQTYELDGTVHEKVWSLRIFQEVTKAFMADHPDFLGARIIISAHRYVACIGDKAFSF